MNRFWTPWRLRWYPVAVVVAIGTGFALHVASADDVATLGGRLGGDFPAFYGAGSIVADGDTEQLYDLERQVEAQRELFPSGDEALYFAYPPYVAAGFRLLVPLGFTTAYVMYTALSVAALWGSIVLAEAMIPVLRGRRMVAFAAALAFHPMTEGALLGQNVAFTLFLIVATWRLAVDGRPWLAGGVLGLLVYKPQFAIPMAGLYLVSRRWKVALGAVVTAAVAYAFSAIMMGPGWVADWLSQARSFSELDVEVNGHLATSAVGFFANLGVEPIGWAAAATTAAILVVCWHRRRADLGGLMAIAASGLIVMAPHAQSYEPGLMLVTLAVFIDGGHRWAAFFWLAALGRLVADALGFNVTAIAVAVALALAVQLGRSDAEVPV
jgi:hypothetical protein